MHDPPANRLSLDRALPYHRDVVTYLTERLPAVWERYASDTTRTLYDDTIELQLLQHHHRLERDSHPDLYAAIDRISASLQINLPTRIFQAADDGSMNAEMWMRPHEVVVVLHGPIQDRLEGDELLAVLAHELAHHRLFTLDGGAYLTAHRALHGLASTGAVPAIESLRLYRLHTEVFADRAGFGITDLPTIIRALVKTRTGLKKVVAEDVLKQAHEAWDRDAGGSQATSHPEPYLRALAIERFAEHGDEADDGIRALLEGVTGLEDLDLLRRDALDKLSRRFVAQLIEPAWFRTDRVLGHTRVLFDDESLPEPGDPITRDDLAPYAVDVHDYLAALLCDYAAVDPDLADLPFFRAHQLAAGLGLDERLISGMNTYLKRTKTSLRASLSQRDQSLDEAEAQAQEQADAEATP